MSQNKDFSLMEWASRRPEEYSMTEQDYEELAELSKAFMTKCRELRIPAVSLWQARQTSDAKYAFSMDSTIGSQERCSATMLLIHSLGAGAVNLKAEAETFQMAHQMRMSGDGGVSAIHNMLAGIFGEPSSTKH